MLCNIRIFCLLLATVATSLMLNAGDLNSDSPSQDVLESSIWFDADQASLKPVPFDPKADDSINRDSRWLPKPKRVRNAPAPAAAATGGGLGLSNWLGWLLLALIAVLLIGLLAVVISKAETPELIQMGANADGKIQLPSQQMAERIKHLPTELRRTDVDLRSEAERLMQSGNFDHAIILLFGHQLLLLDHFGLLRLSRGKTNRKYVRESISADRDIGERLRLTADAFERSYFGRHSIDPAEFDELWQSNSELESRLQQRTETAA